MVDGISNSDMSVLWKLGGADTFLYVHYESGYFLKLERHGPIS